MVACLLSLWSSYTWFLDLGLVSFWSAARLLDLCLWEIVYRVVSDAARAPTVLSLAHAALAAVTSGAWLWRRRADARWGDYNWFALQDDAAAAVIVWRYAAFLVVDLAHARRRPRPWSALEFAHHYAALFICVLGLSYRDCAAALPLYFGSEVSSVLLHARPLTSGALRRALDRGFALLFFLSRTLCCNYMLLLAAKRASSAELPAPYLYITLAFALLQTLMNGYWQVLIVRAAKR